MSHLVFCSHCDEHDPEPEKPSESERSSPNCVGTVRRWIPDWVPDYCDCVGIGNDRDVSPPCGALLGWHDQAEPTFHDGEFGPIEKRTVNGVEGNWHECLLCHAWTPADYQTVLKSVYSADFFAVFEEAESPFYSMLPKEAK